MKEETLTDEQIKNWRRIIFMRLEQIQPGTGTYAIMMPKSEVIAYWRKMKMILKEPKTKQKPISTVKKHCEHSNSITGNNGKYCIDCECYV